MMNAAIANNLAQAERILDERATPRALIVDDDVAVVRAFARILTKDGWSVVTAATADQALAAIDERVDVVLSDIQMPGAGGLELLERVHSSHPDISFVLITGQPRVETAARALECGAALYLSKPILPDQLRQKLRHAAERRRQALLQRRAVLESLGVESAQATCAMSAAFDAAMDELYLVFQPIVSVSGELIAHEALVRTNEPTLRNPVKLIGRAEGLGRLHEIGRAIRRLAAENVEKQSPPGLLFVNLHPRDLLDAELRDPRAPLARIANRVVFEITERAAIDDLADIKECLGELRRMGYRIAIDDLGAGYASLNSLAMLEPEFVKLDMGLIRDVHLIPTKARVAKALLAMCQELGSTTVVEGVETADELAALIEMGPDLLQGYYFGRPAPQFSPTTRWDVGKAR